jgi:hypothetical protein
MNAEQQKTFETAARVKYEQPEFVDMLRALLETRRNEVVSHRDEISVRWAQGRCQELTDLVELLDNAAVYLRKA